MPRKPTTPPPAAESGADEAPAQRGAAATGAPGYSIALILLGILITPVVLSSPTLGGGLNLPQAVFAIAVGSAILLVLAITTLSIGEHARQPTYDIVRFPFGAKGAKAINVLLAICLFGWAVVTANGFGLAAQSLLSQLFGIDVALPLLVALGCVIFVGSTAFGFDILGKVAQFAVPVIALLLAYIVYQALNSTLAMDAPARPIPWGVAVSSVVGTGIILVVTAADFGSFTRNRRQAVLGAVLAFGIAYPCLYIAGAIPSGLTGRSSLIESMAVIASALPAIILLLCATITANAGNFFQDTLAIASLAESVKKWKITVAIGIAVAVLASLDIAAWLQTFLLFLGIAAPPVAGIYIADFLLYRRRGYDNAVLVTQAEIQTTTFIAWLVGSVIGYCTAYSIFTLTGIPSVDSILISALLYVLFSRLRRT